MAPPPAMMPDLSKFPPEYLAADNSAPLFDTCIAFLAIETTFMTLLYVSRIVGSGERDAKQGANLSMLLLMTSAYLVCLCKISVGILAVYVGGAGRHMVTLSVAELTASLKLNTVLQIICPLTTSLSKMSILALLNGILGSTSRKYKLVIRGTFIFVVLTAVVQVIIPMSNCKPFSYNWNKRADGSCAIDGLQLWKFMSIPNVVSTIVMIGIPVPAMWRLRVTPATKLGLCIVFSVCIAGVVAAIARLAAFLQVQSFQDFTWEEIAPLSWTVAESGIYLMAGVLPTLRPLVRKVCGNVSFDRVLSKTFGSSTGSGNKSWNKFVIKDPNNKTGSDVNSKATSTVNDEELGLVEAKMPLKM